MGKPDPIPALVPRCGVRVRPPSAGSQQESGQGTHLSLLVVYGWSVSVDVLLSGGSRGGEAERFPLPTPQGTWAPILSLCSLASGRKAGVVLSSLRCMCFGVGHQAATRPHGCQQTCGHVCWWMERGDPNHTLAQSVCSFKKFHLK